MQKLSCDHGNYKYPVFDLINNPRKKTLFCFPEFPFTETLYLAAFFWTDKEKLKFIIFSPQKENRLKDKWLNPNLGTEIQAPLPLIMFTSSHMSPHGIQPGEAQIL